jgi:hypothetical protein
MSPYLLHNFITSGVNTTEPPVPLHTPDSGLRSTGHNSALLQCTRSAADTDTTLSTGSTSTR